MENGKGNKYQTGEEFVLQARNLVKRFGQVKAVDDVSFSIRRGEVFGLLGPNGAGKTTTIRMLTGILAPDAGEVLVDGLNMSRSAVECKMKMGVIPEIGNVYLDLSAEQNLLLAGSFYGFGRRELRRRADALLERFELLDRRFEPVRAFSKGMKQRVSIASALVHDPQILFLDEPTAGLDVRSQRLIREIIRRGNREGTTVVLTTHHIGEANALCDRVCIVNRGKVAAIDSPESLKSTVESVQSVEVCFSPAPDDPEALRLKDVSKVEKLGDKWKLYTAVPDRVVKHLVSVAARRNLELTALEICKASLEDIFVALTEGRGPAEGGEGNQAPFQIGNRRGEDS